MSSPKRASISSKSSKNSRTPSLTATEPPKRKSSRSSNVDNPPQNDDSKTQNPATEAECCCTRPKEMFISQPSQERKKPPSKAPINITTQTSTSKYTPVPYTFRIANNILPLSSGPNFTKCPPFHVQLDHTLAVVWSVFSNEPTDRPIGVAQLQWALSFLKGIRNNKGMQPKDVQVCIEAMEEALIEQYAAMLDSIKFPDRTCTCSKRKTSADSSVASLNKSDNKSNASENPNDDSQWTTQRFPFSFNYVEMSKQVASNRQKTKLRPFKNDDDIQQKLENLKQSIGAPSYNIPLADVQSRENVVEVLKTWRKEQISKLQEELQRLHSIEAFIGNLDKDNFTPYLDKQPIDTTATQKAECAHPEECASYATVAPKPSRKQSRNKTK